MSQASATEFLHKANIDPQIRQQIQSLGPDAGFEEVLDIAAANGYKITQQDILDAAKARAEAEGASSGEELSEAELEAVAGGRINLTIIKISRDTVRVTVWSTF